MLVVFIISSSKNFVREKSAWVEALCKEISFYVEPVPVASSALEFQERVIDFRSAQEHIERILSKYDLVHDRFIAIIDFQSQRNVYRATEIHALSSVEGALILSFPEIQWIPFYSDESIYIANNSRPLSLELAIHLCVGGYSPLFDGDGLRSCLMIRAHGREYARSDVAIALDEETSFATINAYTAYRFGYRAYTVSSSRVAKELLRDQKRNMLPSAHGLLDDAYAKDNDEFLLRMSNPTLVVFEDVCLEFPDAMKSGFEQIEFGDRRDSREGYPLLKDADLRVISTASRRDEKFVNKSQSPVSAERYMSRMSNDHGGAYKWLRDKCFLRERSKSWLERWWFDIGGDWIGSWGVSILDFLVLWGTLVSAFFYKSILVFPVALALFILRGLLRHWIQHVVENGTSGFHPFGAIQRYFIKRAQWRFLPKRFRAHYPMDAIHNHENTYWEIARKPLAGIFGLRNKCNLPNGRGYLGIDNSERVKALYRNARQHCEFSYKRGGDVHSGHAAPGMAMEIAVRLLRRAKKMAASVNDVEGAVHGAVLATVACELLDYKTPALSIEALTLKHHFELLAECEFVGVQAHLDVSDRYIDIHNAMRRICGSEDGVVREMVYTSGMASIMDRFSALLTEKGKRDEAIYFIRKSRMLHRRMLSPVPRNLLAYPEWAMRSFGNFAISFSVFALIFCSYWMLLEPNNNILHALTKTYEILVSSQPDMTPPEDVSRDTYIAVVQFMRQIALLHVAFLAANFWDFMHRK